jgi:hypothetical protein
MSTKREWLIRFRWLITNGIFFISGVLLGYTFGWIAGAMSLFGLTQVLSDCDWIHFLRTFSIIPNQGNSCEITPDEVVIAFKCFTTWGEFLGMGFTTWKLGEAHKLFYHLLNMKAIHRMTFIRVRKYVHEVNNVFADMISALLYVFSTTFIPLIPTLVAGSIIFSMFFNMVSWFSLIPVLFGSIYVWAWGAECVYMCLYPHRIERELKQANLYISAIEAFEQDQLKRKKLIKGGRP